MTRPTLVLVLALAGACSTKDQATEAHDSDAAEASTQPAIEDPETADAFLAELLPLPDGAEAIEVRYAISGPTLTGELTTLIAPGGLRRDRWELRSTAGDGALRSSGITIINAQDIYTGTEQGSGERRANPLDGLARAYLELPPDTRAGVVKSIRAWHQTLSEQRRLHEGERAEILGVSCLQTRVAAQSVCMWEETGLPLYFEGAAFTIEAVEIDRSAKRGSFDLPKSAANLERVAPATALDYAAILDELAQGSYAKISLVVLGAKGVPELQLPAAEVPGDQQDQ